MNQSMNDKTAVIVLCAGKGQRAKLGFNKMFFPLGPKTTVLETSVNAFRLKEIDEIVVVAAPDEVEEVKRLVPDVTVITGGRTRSDSVRHGLRCLDDKNIKTVLIHDGARPFVTAKLIRKVINVAKKAGSAIPVLPVNDTIKEIVGGYVKATLIRDEVFYVQTPQAFDFAHIKHAYSRAVGAFGDDCEVFERAGYDPKTVEGDVTNGKLTVPSDFMRADLINIGNGFDAHLLSPGRKLIIGGVKIPFPMGLVGHSDADVVTHAVIDAILSAAGLPDIGTMFPDTDPAYEGISSITLLKLARDAVHDAGFKIGSVSAVVIAQAPKMAPYLGKMKSVLAKALRIDVEKCNLSATTTENLGITAEGKGMASHAVATAYRFTLKPVCKQTKQY